MQLVEMTNIHKWKISGFHEDILVSKYLISINISHHIPEHVPGIEQHCKKKYLYTQLTLRNIQISHYFNLIIFSLILETNFPEAEIFQRLPGVQMLEYSWQNTKLLLDMFSMW